ncbi:alpha-(1,3)-fucosyltransferase 9-like [Solea senegalensis]|uniref:Fucosyltransferase n=1 Tax=Solea senegalensis TaxID=28829 RepID=A0AAV6QZW3_SOLSE|nr:4-galactosyl-N-acetylglucosaminide 3-alpha-L-fucosyltransferase 9-like [Solea senegalensis]KAG7497704.1 alpha-(1,3)-fucosyltransferase 9-like [Solea senegalensis]
MSLAGGQMTFLPKCVFSCIMVLCFAGLFFMYYKPHINFPTFTAHTERGDHSCQCPVDAVEQRSNPNCSSEPQIDPTVVQKTQEDAEPDTVVLVWFWPFGFQFDLSCDTYNVKRCLLTADKSLYDEAHGVLIHHRDIRGDNLPKDPRPWFQKWVWFNMESPANTQQVPHIDELFNLTCSYRLDSNIPVPYGHLEPRASGEETFQVPPKDKLVCWIVSNWNPNHRRVQFYNELKKHVNITVYGKAFGKPVNSEEYNHIVSSCKFYLSFENSVYKDYITEKLYRPLMLGALPVTLGPTRQNYEDHVPGDSFIHVHDFPTAKQLADRLLYLDRDDTEYMKYFDWTKRYQTKLSALGQDHACETCRFLQQHGRYQAFRNLKKWYWA